MCNSLLSDTADMHRVRLQFQTNHQSSQKQPFKPKEDEELVKGLKKHGWTNWTNILRDKTLTFSKSRTAEKTIKKCTEEKSIVQKIEVKYKNN